MEQCCAVWNSVVPYGTVLLIIAVCCSLKQCCWARSNVVTTEQYCSVYNIALRGYECIPVKTGQLWQIRYTFLTNTTYLGKKTGYIFFYKYKIFGHRCIILSGLCEIYFKEFNWVLQIQNFLWREKHPQQFVQDNIFLIL